LLLKQAQTNSSLRIVSTFLSDAQLREAEAAFHKLKDSPRPLSFYLDFALSNYREARTDTTVADEREGRGGIAGALPAAQEP